MIIDWSLVISTQASLDSNVHFCNRSFISDYSKVLKMNFETDFTESRKERVLGWSKTKGILFSLDLKKSNSFLIILFWPYHLFDNQRKNLRFWRDKEEREIERPSQSDLFDCLCWGSCSTLWSAKIARANLSKLDNQPKNCVGFIRQN